MNRDYQKYLGETGITLAQAMQRIDANTDGILFLVEQDNILRGCLSDGDIRRFLLNGGKINDPAMNAANTNPKIAGTREEAHLLYHKKNFVAIPVVDQEGRITDVYTGDGSREKQRERFSLPIVINAGGKGTRLDPFTRVLPKPLVPVGDLPIIEHIIKEFQSYGCNEFHIIVNYKKQLLKAYFAENENHYNITWYDEEQPLGTGGGLSLMRGKLKETFFFTNCDNLLTANCARMVQFHKEKKNAITVVGAYKNFPIPYGIIEMGKDGKIEEMREKPVMSFLTNTGIYIVEPEIIGEIEPGVKTGFPDIIEDQRRKGKTIAVFPVSENDWMDMGQPAELEKMYQKLYGE